MIHPSDLLRSDSRSKEFAAPLHTKRDAENDWGISAFPCFAKLFNWRTYGKPSVFVTILSLIGCIQGLLLYYFRNTADLWSKQYNISKDATEWLVYINEFLVTFLAIPITYLATATHRIIWISLLVICHGIFAACLFIPERFLSEFTSVSNTSVLLCNSSHDEPQGDTQYGMVLIIFIYQFTVAASSIGFYCIGLVYIDDNDPLRKSADVAIALASRQFGQQLGIYCSWIPRFLSSQNIFRSFAWQIPTALYFILGLGIAMFPKILPSILIEKLAISLLEIASGHSLDEIKEPNKYGFLPAMKRILTSRIIILSIISTVAFQTALINFDIYENYFKQSRFFIADHFDRYGYKSSFSMNLTTNLIEQPLKVVCLLATGLIISRLRLRIKYLVLWNILIFAIASFLFSSYLFVKCEYEEMAQLVPSCSVDCGCNLDGAFNPVCLQGRTYYSPCHAGCSIEDNLDEVFSNCTCGAFEGKATIGSCHAEKCYYIYQLTQVNNIIAGSLLATTLISNIVIILGSVKKRDKSLAIGLEMTLLSFIPFFPFKLTYAYFADKYCRYRYQGRCRIHSEKFGVFLAGSTIILMIIGTVVQMFLLCADLEKPKRRKIMRISGISSEREVSRQASSTDSDFEDGVFTSEEMKDESSEVLESHL